MTTIRVLTFNIRGATHDDGENIWERRSDLNVRTIQRYAPDLIGFQETHAVNHETYGRELGGYRSVLGPKAENEPPHQHNAIYWNPARLELLDQGGFWLSETPHTWSGSWDTRCIRAANWARFRLADSSAELLHLNTHLDHVSERARVEGSKLIAAHLREIAGDHGPVIVTADFNCNPGSEAYRTFMQAGFTDTHLAAGNAPENTFHGFEGDAFEPRYPNEEGRIDWILHRDNRAGNTAGVRSCVVLRAAEPPIFPSDHYPVLAEIAIPA